MVETIASRGSEARPARAAAKFLRNLPLRQKLTSLAMTCSVVALLTTAVALGAYEWVFFRRTMFSHLTTLASITARDSAATLAFGDPDDAARVLAALHAEPAVKMAALYDGRGHRFAAFRRNIEEDPPPRAPSEDGVFHQGDDLLVVVPVGEGKRFGTLVMAADVSAIQVRVAGYAIVLLSTTVVSGLLAFLLARWLEERIVAPVQALAAAAARVRNEADYSLRVPKEADDEVGALTDAFNDMMVRIEQHEAELANGAERLRIAVESARIGTWEWDLVRDTVRLSDRSEEVLGVPPGTTMPSLAFFELVHGEDRTRVQQRFIAAMGGGSDFATDFRVVLRAPEERLRYIAIRGRFVKTAHGSVQRAVGVMLDITDRRMAEIRAVESELRFRAVAERAPAMIWSSDGLLHRDYFNKTWLSFTGRTLEEELGSAWQAGVPAPDLARWREVAGAAAAHRDPYSVEYRLRRADGALRWVIETGAPRPGPDGAFAGYLGSCIDITTRKENEEELEARVRGRTRELESANRELESFSYSVSHDLRGPVRAIQGFAEIAREEIEAEQLASARERIDRVLRAADRMNKLIDAFIGMARISRAELRVDAVNLSRIAEEVIAFLRSMAPERAVDVTIAPGLSALGDERLLRIALENLLSNAWKFTSRAAAPRIEFGARAAEDGPVFFVADNGAGFDPALAHKLFHPFERLHPGSEFEGMGVGLNTVRRVIEKHGGRVWAESRVGQGATFFFTVPGRAG